MILRVPCRSDSESNDEIGDITEEMSAKQEEEKEKTVVDLSEF